MKIAIILTLITITLSLGLNAQINLDKVVKKSKKKTEQKIEQRIENKIDKAVDNTLDDIEGGAKNESESKKNDKSNKNEKNSKGNDSDMVGSDDATKPSDNNSSKNDDTKEPETKPQSDPAVLVWNKFDFVPGSEIIFDDNLQGEQNGEFPSKWDLSGGVVENASFNGENVIMFRSCNINGLDGIVPLLKNSKEDYLPEEFTIEFDAYYEGPNNTYRIYLMDPKNQRNLEPSNNTSNRFYFRFDQNSADGRDISTSYYPGFNSSNNSKSSPSWRHISISFNKRAIKVYIDDARVLNIPNVDFNPVGICLGFHNPNGEKNGYIKNIRIAKGAVPLYDKVLTDGKFITSGIKFDINKATIKPESMGTINYVFKMMNDNPDLKFSVEGHTDSDGDDATNQKLSEDRAKAVMNKLIEMGIDKSRLTSKGFGESKPMSDNSTPEGKAQNRRVEFVKF
jgi:OmpA-OmpF porin, OOP family